METNQETSSLPDAKETTRLLEEAQVFDLEGALDALREYLSFSQPWHARLCLLWAVSSYLREVLPSHAIHLAFSGGKSSGKSEATKLMTQLTPQGIYLAGGTLPAFIRAFEEYSVIGIDELDSNIHKLPELEAMLRAASDRDSIYQTSIPGKGRTWISRDVPVGGSVVYNYRSQIEDALLSRTLVIEMPKQNDSGLVLRNLLGGNPPREAIKDYLARKAGKRLKEWSLSRVDDHMREPAFRERLDALPTVLARQTQIAACLLIVSDIMGWDLEEAIREALRTKQEEEESYEDVRQHLLEFYTLGAPRFGEDWSAPFHEAHAFVNMKRKDARLPPLSPHAFARVRRELGWQKGKNDRKDRTQGNKVILTFDQPVREALGVEPEDGRAGP